MCQIHEANDPVAIQVIRVLFCLTTGGDVGYLGYALTGLRVSLVANITASGEAEQIHEANDPVAIQVIRVL
ncbi:MAG: hypothetical protein AAFO67_07325, partial [Planctomycetota bacterium]